MNSPKKPPTLRHARTKSGLPEDEQPLLAGWLARCAGLAGAFLGPSLPPCGAQGRTTPCRPARLRVPRRESGVVDKLLNRRYGALYASVLCTYRKETDEVQRRPPPASSLPALYPPGW